MFHQWVRLRLRAFSFSRLSSSSLIISISKDMPNLYTQVTAGPSNSTQTQGLQENISYDKIAIRKGLLTKPEIRFSHKAMKIITYSLLILTLFFAPPAIAPAEEAGSFAHLRGQMVKRQIISRGVKDPRGIKAMERVKRHLFVPER